MYTSAARQRTKNPVPNDLQKRRDGRRLIYAHYADPSLLEELMEIAVNIGDFDAVDMLDKLL